jgi:two-component system chemotaxis sensor kinase CheA
MPNIGGERSKKDFLGEAEDLLTELNHNLEELEETYGEAFNPDTLNAIFRGVHSLKGLSGIFGFRKMTDLSHRLESLLDRLRLGKIDLNQDTLELIFESLDNLKMLLDDAEKGEEVTDIGGILSKIDVFMTGGVKGPEISLIDTLDIDPEIIKVLTEYEEHRLKANLKEGRRLFLLKAGFDLQSFDKDLENLNRQVKAIGEVITTLPSSGTSPQEGIQFTLLVGSSEDLEGISKKVGEGRVTVEEVLKKKRIETREVQAPKPVEPKVKTPSATDMSLKSTSKTVRVNIERLDRLMNTVGELVLTKAAVGRISKELKDVYGYTTFALDLQRVSQSLDKKLAVLQNDIIEVRMVPVGQIFSRLTQVVRRYTRERGKEVDLEFYGEDTEIDKFLAEEIVDPLMHIIRNAIDHGIEPSDIRRRSGKKEKGTVQLRAFPRGNHVAITIEDDGAGIDLDIVLKKAIEKGLVEKDAQLNRRETLELLFLPGLTTKRDVTEVSGRGVGLDIVKTKVSELSGFIDIDTELGRGTTFTITLPITLAIIKALIVEVSKEIFAIPLTSVSESLMIPKERIQKIEKKEVLELRGEMLPLMWLDRTFQLPPQKEDSENINVVVVGFGERRIGLVVGELMGQQEIVIKSLGESLKGVPGISGAAELGRYQVILVLDVEALIEEAMGRRRV